MSESTLVSCLERAAASNAGIRFVGRAEEERLWTYEQIYHRATLVAGALERLGVKSGDRVAIVLPTCIEFFEAFYGCSILKAVPVPLYPPVRLGRLDEYHRRTAEMLRACGARLVLTEPRIGRLLGRTLVQSPPNLEAVLVKDLPLNRTGPRSVAPDDLALIQFSSGTGDAPKPVCLTHRQILANVEAIRGVILSAYPEGPDFEHVGVSWLPLYHDMGLVGAVFTALAHPSDLVLLPPEIFVARPAVWLRTLSKYKGTVSPAPNFAYALCVQRVRDEELAGVDLSSWCLALNGAEPVTPNVLNRFVRRFQAYGLKARALTPVYGLAEATLAVTFSHPLERFQCTSFDRDLLATRGVAKPVADGLELVSVGRPLPGFEVQILNGDGRRVEERQVGEIRVRGPSIMKGYHDLPRATSQALKNGWLATGDTGFIHGDELYLYGRKKDMIVLRGRNYAPQEIELTLEDLPGIRPGCAVAAGIVEEKGDGEVLMVFVERTRSSRPTAYVEIANEVRRRVLERVGLGVNRVLVLEPGTLPRTSSGKIRRGEAKKRFLAGKLTPPKSVNAWRLAGEVIRSKLSSYSR